MSRYIKKHPIADEMLMGGIDVNMIKVITCVMDDILITAVVKSITWELFLGLCPCRKVSVHVCSNVPIEKFVLEFVCSARRTNTP
jgi:hypothetical protein